MTGSAFCVMGPAMKRISLLALVAFVASADVACRSSSDVAPEPSARATAVAAPAVPEAVLHRPFRIVEAPSTGTVEAVARDARSSAVADGRTLVVYVGASWCEPCQRFHHAAERGELDSELPNVALLEFDLDRDRDRLAAAGYSSKYIPLFALPTPEGLASSKRIEGGIKGEGAVGFIVPRLKEMLAER
jgi:thiol-disulfide isomerase/thioredoxin